MRPSTYLLPFPLLLLSNIKTTQAIAFHPDLHWDQIYFDTPWNITWVNNRGPIYITLDPSSGGPINENIPANSNGYLWTPIAQANKPGLGLIDPAGKYRMSMFDDDNFNVESPEFKIMTLPFSTIPKPTNTAGVDREAQIPKLSIATVPNPPITSSNSPPSKETATATATASNGNDIKNAAQTTSSPSSSSSPTSEATPIPSPGEINTNTRTAIIATLSVLPLLAIVAGAFIFRRRRKHARSKREWAGHDMHEQSYAGDRSLIGRGGAGSVPSVEVVKEKGDEGGGQHGFIEKQELHGEPICFGGSHNNNNLNTHEPLNSTALFNPTSSTPYPFVNRSNSGENGMGYKSGVDTGLGDLNPGKLVGGGVDGGEAERSRAQVLVHTMLHGGVPVGSGEARIRGGEAGGNVNGGSAELC